MPFPDSPRKPLLPNPDQLPLGQRLQAIFRGVFEAGEEAEEFRRCLEEHRKGTFHTGETSTSQTTDASMTDLLIRDVPEPLKQEIAQAAKADGQSLSAKAVDLLRKGLLLEQQEAAGPRQSAWTMLRSAFEETGGADGEFAKIMEEIEAERKRDFGRPVDFGFDTDR